MSKIKPGDIVKLGSARLLYIAGREVRAGKRRVWSYRSGRSCFVSAGRIVRTGYNIHTNNPYTLDEPV